MTPSTHHRESAGGAKESVQTSTAKNSLRNLLKVLAETKLTSLVNGAFGTPELMKLTVLAVLISLAAVLPVSATDGATKEKKDSSASAADSCCESDAEKPAGNKESAKSEKKPSADSKSSSSADSASTPSAH